MTNDLLFAGPELMLAIGAMLLLMAGAYGGDRITLTVSRAAVALLIMTAFYAAARTPADPSVVFGGGFVVDSFGVFCKVVTLLGSALAILMSEKYLQTERLARFEYPVLIVLAALGMILMISANDLISLYVGVELQSLALYVLAAFNRDSQRATEAGLKYFVLGALSSGLLLYGASLIYGFTGTTLFDGIAAAVAADTGPSVGLTIGLVFLISGLAFKISAAPFHMWTPDVYEGAPTPVTAFLAAAPKLAAMAMFTRAMVAPFPEIIEDWRQIIVLIAVASMAVGAFSAIVQTNIKRLMAYSSIGHMGYALLGLAAGDAQGVQAVLVYMAVYVVTTAGAFAFILAMRRPEGMVEQISDLSGLSRTQPGLAVAMTVLLFSLAGVPPTVGFLAKWYVFMAAVDTGLIWLAVVGLLTSVVGAYYYLAIVKTMWFDEPAPRFERSMGATLSVTLTSSALLAFPVLVIAMGPLHGAAGRAAASLFTGG
ncbi:MAG: NADH-quinone oxidoreductase subunit NuoN [Pseudomonadota bacterium]